MIKGQSKHASQLNQAVNKSPFPKRTLPQIKDSNGFNIKSNKKNPINPLKLKEQKIQKITFTGFNDQSQKQLIYLKQQAQNLGLQVSDILTVQTEILVADQMLTSKVRFALSLNIPIVESNWIYESTKQNHIIPYQQYYKKMFDNIKIGVIGFEQEEIQELKIIIEEQGGLIYNDLNNIQQNNEQAYSNKSNNELIQFAIINEQKQEKCIQVLQKLQIYGVTQLWLYQCIERSSFVWPLNYIINKDQKSKYSPDLQNGEQKQFKLKELQQKISKIPALKKYHYLQDCVIYISAQDKSQQLIMEHLVTLGSGCFVNIMLPNVTHVVVEDNLTLDEQSYFQSINGNIKIVNYFWLHNSFLTFKKEREEDYKVNKIVQERIQTQKSNSQIQNDTFQNEQSNNFLNNNSQSIQHQKRVQKYQQNKQMRLSRTQSLNLMNAPANKFESYSQQDDLNQEQGIFSGLHIYIKIFNDENLNQSYCDLVKQNGGIVTKKIQPHKNNIVVLSDHKTNKVWIETFQKKKDKGLGSENVMFVSHRWIDYCIEKKDLVQKCLLDKYSHLQPILHQTPFRDFLNLKIAISYKESEVIYKIVLQSYVKILGGEACSSDINKIKQKKIQLTHLICDQNDGKQFQQKVKEIKSHFANKIYIVSPQWLLECVTQGYKVDEQQFILY